MPLSADRVSPAAVRPFLKWAGGKRQLLQELRRFIPEQFNAYHEPFLGSGAVFFDLWQRGLLAGHACTLTDINADLVGCYAALAHDPGSVIRELRQLAIQHAVLGTASYYRVRDEVFNPRRRQLLLTEKEVFDAPDLAAMLIYLNRTGYNGLFRVNSRGEFNVPAGRYAKPQICDEPTLRAVAAVLAQPAVQVRRESFLGLESRAQGGDLVYLDPPYAPVSVTARFTSYTMASFSDADQERLQALVIALVRRGCYVVLSNSTAPLVTKLYNTGEAIRAGLRAHRVAARRAINSKSGGRGAIEEYVISNVGTLSLPRNSAYNGDLSEWKRKPPPAAGCTNPKRPSTSSAPLLKRI